MCYVELSFNSKDKIKVEEEARKKYKELENIISFMCGDIDKKLGYATFNFKLQQPTNYVMYDTKSEELTENIQAGDSIRIPIELDREDKWFFQQENGNYFIWELLKDKSNYNIKKRILLAIQLIGNGLNQEDTRLAFLQFATAIEAMLQNDKGFITKSITAHIAEYGAFILSDKKDERIKLEKRIKEIYGVRSGIAHGHKKEDFMLNEAFYIAKMIVIECK